MPRSLVAAALVLALVLVLVPLAADAQVFYSRPVPGEADPMAAMEATRNTGIGLTVAGGVSGLGVLFSYAFRCGINCGSGPRTEVIDDRLSTGTIVAMAAFGAGALMIVPGIVFLARAQQMKRALVVPFVAPGTAGLSLTARW